MQSKLSLDRVQNVKRIRGVVSITREQKIERKETKNRKNDNEKKIKKRENRWKSTVVGAGVHVHIWSRKMPEATNKAPVNLAKDIHLILNST